MTVAYGTLQEWAVATGGSPHPSLGRQALALTMLVGVIAGATWQLEDRLTFGTQGCRHTAQAGIHGSAARAADGWVRACTGTTKIGNQTQIRATRRMSQQAPFGPND